MDKKLIELIDNILSDRNLYNKRLLENKNLINYLRDDTVTWNTIFKYINEYINSNDIKDLFFLVNLLENFYRDQTKFFNENEIINSFDILSYIVKNLPPSDLKKYELGIFNRLNFKTYKLIIDLSALLNNEKQNYRLDDRFKQYFQEKINSSDIDFEFYAVVASNLSKLNFLEPEWLEKNLYKIFDLNKDVWIVAFTFYLQNNNFTYDYLNKLYECYKKAIFMYIPDSSADLFLVSHITASYLIYDIEELINLLIESKNARRIEFLIKNLYWNNITKYQEKLTYLLKKIYTTIAPSIEDEKFKYVMGILSFWYFLIEDKKSTINYFKITASHLRYTDYFKNFKEKLDKTDDEYAYLIYKYMYKSNNEPKNQSNDLKIKLDRVLKDDNDKIDD